MLGVQLKMLPVAFSIFGFLLQLKSNFTVIFMEGGIGKNKSTVAVSTLVCLNCWIQPKGLSVCENCCTYGLVVCVCVCVCVHAHVCACEFDDGFMHKLFDELARHV